MQVRDKIMAAAVAAIWGGNFVAAKLALHALPAFTLLGIRFVMVTIFLSPLLFIRPRPPMLKQVALLSFLLCICHFSLMFSALKMGLDVSTGLITTQLGVPFSCLLGSILFSDRIGRWRSLGMLISFVGIVVIAGTPKVAVSFWPFAVSCCAAFAWAVANITMKRLGDTPIMPLLAWLSLFAIPQYIVLVTLFDDAPLAHVMAAGPEVWISLLYTVLGSTILAYGMWYSLLARFPVSQVAPYSLLVPVFGFGAAQAFFHEPLTPQFLIGGGLTLLGVAVIIFRQPRFARLGEP